MTDNKLTLADCLKYPNAKILDYTGSKDNPNDYRNIYDYIYKQGQLDGMNLEEITEDIFNDYYICNCKLILRDISELTDEEMEKISNDYLFVKCYSVKLFNELFGIISVGKLINYIANKENLLLPLFDYLRSINIDIDGFIKSGKAVKG